jgi:hypothetical protein
MEHLKSQFIKSLFEVIKEKGVDSDNAFKACIRLVREYTDIVVEKTRLLQEDETKAMYYLKQLVIDFMNDFNIHKAEHWIDQYDNLHQIVFYSSEKQKSSEEYIHRINKLIYDFTTRHPNRNIYIINSIDKDGPTGRLIEIF